MNINNSFTPSQFKLANITPIGKVPNPQIATDFRPIAILSATEKIFQSWLNTYSASKNIFG